MLRANVHRHYDLGDWVSDNEGGKLRCKLVHDTVVRDTKIPKTKKPGTKIPYTKIPGTKIRDTKILIPKNILKSD